MLSKNEIKWITSLKNKKYRHIHGAFLAEGPKLVNDLLLNDIIPIKIFTTITPNYVPANYQDRVVIVKRAELSKISCLKTPNEVLAVFEMCSIGTQTKHPEGEWGIALENLQDPGNLGTILRTLDWLGINTIYCSKEVVDVYNPKVVQASMGSIGRVKVHYLELDQFFEAQIVKIYAADMGGDSIHQTSLEPGIIVFGNEGNGLSDNMKATVNQIISIPKFGKGESLNVAMSVGIIGSWLKMNEN